MRSKSSSAGCSPGGGLPAGAAIPLAVVGVRQRCRAFLLDRQVAGVVLVVQTDELASGGSPVDRVTSVRVVDRQLVRQGRPDEPAEEEETVEIVIERFRGSHAAARTW